MYKLQNYWKFIIVRNPLERLLAAFLNKLSSTLAKQEKVRNEFEIIKRKILTKYNPEMFRVLVNSNYTHPVRLDFESYIKWILDTPSYSLNEHFAPLTALAQPCRVQYNFYGNFKLYSADMNAIIDKLKAPKKYFINGNYHDSGSTTEDKMAQYYPQVSKEVKLKLAEHIAEDLDFYYTLFPEEKDSHVSILGF